jgi:hypothetical protein
METKLEVPPPVRELIAISFGNFEGALALFFGAATKSVTPGGTKLQLRMSRLHE